MNIHEGVLEMKEQFEDLRASKKERMEAIQSIIQKHDVRNQEQLVNLLKKIHKISTNQSAVSRDVKSLGLVKDENTGCYVLSQESRQKQLFKELAVKAREAEVEIFDGPVEGLLCRTSSQKIESAPLIASYIEKIFSTDQIPVAAFFNNSGYIWLIFPEKKKKIIQKNLKKIFLLIKNEKG